MLFLLISLVVISLAFSGANFLAWKLFDRPRHALVWSATYALVGIQYAINLAKAFPEASERLLAQSQRNGKALSFILCDADHFKAINDKYGHAHGDIVSSQGSGSKPGCHR